MSATTTRVRGLAPWLPQRSTVELLGKVREVLAEYAAYLPLTVRQIFYRLVGVHGYDKTEAAYSRLGEHLNRARRAGLIGFAKIRDDGTTIAEPDNWRDTDQLVQSFIAAAERIRFDRQKGQPVRLMFAVEAGGMVPQVQRIADGYGIAVHSSGGFDSVTAKYDLAVRLAQFEAVEVLHIGDHDPSGVHLFLSMAEDVAALADDLAQRHDWNPPNITFSRLAVTPEQIVSLGLTTAPPKPTDRRAFEGETVQCEAIPPNMLAEIVTSAITSRFDADAYADVLAEEDVARVTLGARLRRLLAP